MREIDTILIDVLFLLFMFVGTARALMFCVLVVVWLSDRFVGRMFFALWISDFVVVVVV